MASQELGRVINDLRDEQRKILQALVDQPSSDFVQYRQRVAEYNRISKDIEVIIKHSKGVEDDDSDDSVRK